MPDTWDVTPTSVKKNGAAIVGYVAHSLSIRNNSESHPFLEASVAVRVIDPHSEAAREAPLATLRPIEQTMVLIEYANHPSFSEYRSKAGDIINVSGSYTAGAGDQPSSIAGSGTL